MITRNLKPYTLEDNQDGTIKISQEDCYGDTSLVAYISIDTLDLFINDLKSIAAEIIRG